MPDPKQITGDLRNSFRGRLAFEDVLCRLYSTDASPFQVLPLGIAFPEDTADLSVLTRYAFENAISLIPRGAGTGVAGESLGPGLVVDLSAAFRRIVDIGPDTVTVEPGVVLAELNAALAQHGRRFAPDPASGASCTLGGMIATNASGGNAFRHGYTRDHIAGLGVVWDDGTADTIGNPEAGSEPHERTAAIRAATAALLRDNQELIHLTRPHTAFNRCGYLLHDILTPARVDLAKLLVGSEGTLGFITQATLRTVPLPGGTCLALLGFPTLDAAVNAGLDLRAFAPVSCDLLDRRLLAVTQTTGTNHPTGAALVVAFEADTEWEAEHQAREAIEKLRAAHRLAILAEPTCAPEAAARIRAVRTAAVSGLYGLGRGPRPVAFIEDVGVPADTMPDYIAQVQDVLKRFELSGSFLIHTLTGQVHTRPLIDLNDPADRAKLWPVAEAVHGIALALGGTISTQHGTGIARTPWVEKQYGPVLPVFRELKRIFDPKGLLNPGKIIGPDPSRPAWPLRSMIHDSQPGEPAPDRTPLLLWKGSSPTDEAAKCTGCGDCRSLSHGRMCPAFRAAPREEASTRAMANAVRELAETEGLASDEMHAIAARCINCRMCRSECPAKVDAAKLMLEAKAAHNAEHGLSRADWLLARTESLALLGSNFAPLVNAVLGSPSARWLLEKVFGLSRRRRLTSFTLRNFYRRARGMGLTRKRPTRSDKAQTGGEKVAYFVDIFAAYNDPFIGEATVAVLRHNGIKVYVPRRQVGCGMSPLAVGNVDAARDAAMRNIRVMADLIRDGYRVVCSEPTAALMLTQDYPDLLADPDAALLAANTTELTAYLWELHAAGRLNTNFRRLDVTLGHHVPCHVKALPGPAAGPRLLALIPGVTTHTLDVSCSGMAGTWGVKAENYEASLAIGRRMFDELNRPQVLFGSTECSACRMQMQEGSGKRALHPVQYLAHAYGLLPEIGVKLHKPLGNRISD